MLQFIGNLWTLYWVHMNNLAVEALTREQTRHTHALLRAERLIPASMQ